MSTTRTENGLIELSPEKLLNVIHRVVFPGAGGTPDGPAGPPPPHRQDGFRETRDPQGVTPPDFSSKWSSLQQETWDGWLRLTAPGQVPYPELFSFPAAGVSRFSLFAARHPEIYELAGGGHYAGNAAHVNPQPLPPRLAFLVAFSQAVISRARLIHETAAAVLRSTGQREIIVVGGYASDVADELCPPQPLSFPWPRWTYPGPHPDWLHELLDGPDLLVLGSQFAAAAQQTSVSELRQDFSNAADTFAQAGIAALT